MRTLFPSSLLRVGLRRQKGLSGIAHINPDLASPGVKLKLVGLMCTFLLSRLSTKPLGHKPARFVTFQVSHWALRGVYFSGMFSLASSLGLWPCTSVHQTSKTRAWVPEVFRLQMKERQCTLSSLRGQGHSALQGMS